MITAEVNGDGFVDDAELTAVVPNFDQLDFDRIDTNSDNRLSQAELQAPGVNALIAGEAAQPTQMSHSALDADSDMFLTYGELLAGFPNVPQVEFDEIDENGDNRISQNEWNSSDTMAKLNQY